MANTAKAVAVDTAPVVAGEDLSARVTADATADSTATTVAGQADAAADVQAAVGILDSTVTVGGDATYLINETGLGTAAAVSVAETATATAQFSGETGGFIDSLSASDIDFTAGGTALLDVQVGNTATAKATSTAADATAIGLISETYGLQDIGLRVGSNGTLNANVDADVASTANTIGYLGIPADATANTTATNVAAISGLGNGTNAANSDFVFGDNATITASAGTLADRVSLSAAATNVGGSGDGDASATVDSTAISGITAATGTDGGATNVLAVGNDAAITARAYVEANASALSVAGDAGASTNLDTVDGIQADTVIIGDNGTLKGFASTLSTTAAETTDLTARAENTLFDSQGIQLDNLTIGNTSVSTGGFGVLGVAGAKLNTTATTRGDSSGDVAEATGSSGNLIGVQLGDGDSTTVDSGLNVGRDISLAGSSDLASTATASAIDGGATATSQSIHQVSGVVLNQAGASRIGVGGTILATGNVNLDATASNVGTAGGSDDARAFADTTLVQGMGLIGKDTSLTIGDGGTINASASVTSQAKATSIEANALAESAIGATYYGIKSPDSDVTIGAAGVINATATDTVGATATTVTGDATAEAVPEDVVGLLSADLTIGAGGSITAGANTTAKAAATSVDATSIANTGVSNNIGINALGAVTVGAAGTINATAAAVLQAFADTTGDDSSDDEVLATTDIGYNVGYFADQAATRIGAGGTVIGAASLTGTSAATGIQADAASRTLVNNNLGIDLAEVVNTTPSVIDQTLSVGADGTVTGSANGITSSSATTTNGNALALTDVDLTGGLGDGGGVVRIGANGTISGTANAISTAIAAAIDADGDSIDPDFDVEAIVSNDFVSGIDLTSLITGDAAAITATAVSAQTATASNVGDPIPLDSAKVRASAADTNAITGLDSTTVTVGGDLSRFSAGAQLTAAATASNINSSLTDTGVSAKAESGLGSVVIGVDESNLAVGRNVTAAAGLRADAISNLTANASGVAGGVRADAGNATTGVIGINSSDLTVGNSGNATAVASSTLNANASTISGDARAEVQQQADGLRDSAVSIGNDGNVTGQATLIGNAAAVTVGSQPSPDDATAGLTLSSSGIDQSAVPGAAIVIGDTGNVSGSGFVSGSSSALTIDGNAAAGGLFQAQGIDLRSGGDSDITIDRTGNIAGLAVIGTLNSAGGLGAPVTVSATSTAGTADANGDFDAEGIAGLEDLEPLYLNPTLLIAGPVRGDVSGQAMGGGQVTASNIGRTSADTATATNNLSQLFGLQNVDIVAGLTGTNLVKGTAFGDFDVKAASVAGDSKATSNSDVYGIFDQVDKGNITLSGNVSAIAQLTNNASTKSVAGKSSSGSTGEAIGLKGYEVNVITGGNLVASAFANTGSSASSVSGDASA